MMRLAVVLIGCVALTVAQFPFLPLPYQQLPAGWPNVAAPVTPAPATVPTVTPIHHRNPAAEQQLANTVLAHEHNDRVLQQQQLQQLATITGVAPGVSTSPYAGSPYAGSPYAGSPYIYAGYPAYLG